MAFAELDELGYINDFMSITQKAPLMSRSRFTPFSVRGTRRSSPAPSAFTGWKLRPWSRLPLQMQTVNSSGLSIRRWRTRRMIFPVTSGSRPLLVTHPTGVIMVVPGASCRTLGRSFCKKEWKAVCLACLAASSAGLTMMGGIDLHTDKHSLNT